MKTLAIALVLACAGTASAQFPVYGTNYTYGPQPAMPSYSYYYYQPAAYPYYYVPPTYNYYAAPLPNYMQPRPNIIITVPRQGGIRRQW